MSVINTVGNALTGVTGTGTFVGATSPTLVTPTLGAATATSVNFGGGAYANYIPPTAFTPVFTFATPGDLSIPSYTAQTGTYSQDGNIINIIINLQFTPTFTTSSGEIRITGFPVAPAATMASYLLLAQNSTTPTYPASTTQLNASIASGNTYATLVAQGSSVAATTLTTANVVSGTQVIIRLHGFYLV